MREKTMSTRQLPVSVGTSDYRPITIAWRMEALGRVGVEVGYQNGVGERVKFK